jgi:hypothetical protein
MRGPRSGSLEPDCWRADARPRLKCSPQDRRSNFVLEAEARAGPRIGAAQSKVASNDQSRRCSGLPPRLAGALNAGRLRLVAGSARWRAGLAALLWLCGRGRRGEVKLG